MNRQEVLIVDDNVDLAENMAEIIEDLGFIPRVYHSPKKALEELTPDRYAVALLDIRMPEMDGVELYQHLKQRDPVLPAIAITAYAHDDRVQTAVEHGIIAVLSKPLDVPSLLEKISSLVEGECVLIVEDDNQLAHNLSELLLPRGFSPRMAGTCQEARQIAHHLPFSIILTDWRLPDGNGIELIEELFRQNPDRTSCIPIVFSGYPREMADPDNKIEANGITFFEKPLPIEQLLKRIAPSEKKPR